jgi:hypothetical protein
MAWSVESPSRSLPHVEPARKSRPCLAHKDVRCGRDRSGGVAAISRSFCDRPRHHFSRTELLAQTLKKPLVSASSITCVQKHCDRLQRIRMHNSDRSLHALMTRLALEDLNERWHHHHWHGRRTLGYPSPRRPAASLRSVRRDAVRSRSNRIIGGVKYATLFNSDLTPRFGQQLGPARKRRRE